MTKGLTCEAARLSSIPWMHCAARTSRDLSARRSSSRWCGRESPFSRAKSRRRIGHETVRSGSSRFWTRATSAFSIPIRIPSGSNTAYGRSGRTWQPVFACGKSRAQPRDLSCLNVAFATKRHPLILHIATGPVTAFFHTVTGAIIGIAPARVRQRGERYGSEDGNRHGWWRS